MDPNRLKTSYFPYILLFMLTGCSYRSHVSPTKAAILPGTYATYNSAMGSGSGILFHIKLPETFLETNSIDSFFIAGKYQGFSIRKIGKINYLESLYHSAASVKSSLADPRKATLPANEPVRRDSLMNTLMFYPSWIIVSGKSGKQRFDISSYQEEAKREKY